MDNEHNFDYEEGCEHGVYPHTWKKRQKQSMCMIMNRVKRRMNTLPVNTTIPYWWIRQYICVVPVIPMVGMLPVVAMRGHRFLVITIMRMRLSWELLVTTLVVADRISMRVFVIYRDVHLHHVFGSTITILVVTTIIMTATTKDLYCISFPFGLSGYSSQKHQRRQ